MTSLDDMATLFGQAACLLLVAAMLMPDLRRLRLVAFLAGLAAVAWAFMAGNTLALAWSALFVLANAGQMALARHRARAGVMTAEERALIEQILEIEEPAQQRRLRDVMSWRDADTGEVLIRQGQMAPPLIFIATGQMDIEHDGLPVGTCGPQDFIGEMSLISGDGASATVKVAMPARIAVFDREGLVRLVSGMPELSRALDRTLNRGLALKIQRMNKASRDKWNIAG